MQTKESYEQVCSKLPTSYNDIRNLSDQEIDNFLEPLSLMDKIRILKNHFPLTYRYPEFLYKKYRKQIMQQYMNARLTEAQALGHGKGDRNRFARNKYAEFMIELNIPVPVDAICFVLGDFNGEGSM